MSRHFPVCNAHKVVRVLRRPGFALVDQRGSHQKWRHSDGRQVIVAQHGNKPIPSAPSRASSKAAAWPRTISADRGKPRAVTGCSPSALGKRVGVRWGFLRDSCRTPFRAWRRGWSEHPSGLGFMSATRPGANRRFQDSALCVPSSLLTPPAPKPGTDFGSPKTRTRRAEKRCAGQRGVAMPIRL